MIQLHKLCGCEIVEEKKNHVCKEGVWYDVTFMRMTAERWNSIRSEKSMRKSTFLVRSEGRPQLRTPVEAKMGGKG